MTVIINRDRGMARSAFSGTQLTDRLARWLDDRQRISGIVQSLRTRAVADHWSSLFGQLAVASFVVCTVTGVILLFFYDPSTAPVTYRGSYGPLQGVQMSRALESTLEVSFEVRGGLLVRQLHHWSASLMIAAIMLHLLRTFFTGGFRRPRTRSWLVWFAILLLGMGAGLSGHILPDDLLSGSSLAVMDGLLKSIPVAGAWLSALVFQGEFPTGAVTTFFPLHVAALPATVPSCSSCSVGSPQGTVPPSSPVPVGPRATSSGVPCLSRSSSGSASSSSCQAC